MLPAGLAKIDLFQLNRPEKTIAINISPAALYA